MLGLSSNSLQLAYLDASTTSCESLRPPGVITSTLHDIAEMLRISANHRTRRRHCARVRFRMLSVEKYRFIVSGSLCGRHLNSIADFPFSFFLLVTAADVSHSHPAQGETW